MKSYKWKRLAWIPFALSLGGCPFQWPGTGEAVQVPHVDTSWYAVECTCDSSIPAGVGYTHAMYAFSGDVVEDTSISEQMAGSLGCNAVAAWVANQRGYNTVCGYNSVRRREAAGGTVAGVVRSANLRSLDTNS